MKYSANKTGSIRISNIGAKYSLVVVDTDLLQFPIQVEQTVPFGVQPLFDVQDVVVHVVVVEYKLLL